MTNPLPNEIIEVRIQRKNNQGVVAWKNTPIFMIINATLPLATEPPFDLAIFMQSMANNTKCEVRYNFRNLDDPLSLGQGHYFQPK